MSKSFLLAALSILLATQGNAADCSTSFTPGTTAYDNCIPWALFGRAFNRGPDWTTCKGNKLPDFVIEDPCDVSLSCGIKLSDTHPIFLTCENGMLAEIHFEVDNNLHVTNQSSVSSAFEALAKLPSFKSVTVENQQSMNLAICPAECGGNMMCTFRDGCTAGCTDPACSPTPRPTESPTKSPTTAKPTTDPTRAPSQAPTTAEPTMEPTTPKPTNKPTDSPTNKPTPPTKNPTQQPTDTAKPTFKPTFKPTTKPSEPITSKPTTKSTSKPSKNPTPSPTKKSDSPTDSPVETGNKGDSNTTFAPSSVGSTSAALTVMMIAARAILP